MFRGANDTLGDHGAGGSEQGPPTRALVGKVYTAVGPVIIARAGVQVRPAGGSPLFEGDVIETGPGGQASLGFIDGTTFELYANARAVLDRFVCDGIPSARSALVRVERGKFGFIPGGFAITGRLVVETPSARI